MKRNYRAFIFLIVTISLIVIAVSFYSWFFHYKSSIKFESKSWKEAEGKSDSIRINMIDNLIEEYRLVGKSRYEIEELLGKPAKTDYFTEYEYVYWLGPERGFISIDSAWLGIKFKDNIVTETHILKD